MKKLFRSKCTKLMAMVMAAVMLLSMTLIQAYGVPSASTTVAGYSVRASISKPDVDYFKLEVVSGERMIHDISMSGTFRNSSTGRSKPHSVTSSYNGWDIYHNFYGPSDYNIGVNATGQVTSYYNGISGGVTVNI